MNAPFSIFDCCDVCDALLSDAERERGERFGQTLCDGCAAGYADEAAKRATVRLANLVMQHQETAHMIHPETSALDRMLAAEAEAGSPCAITVRRMKDGSVAARMSFAPGMESAVATGATVDEAMSALSSLVGFA